MNIKEIKEEIRKLCHSRGGRCTGCLLFDNPGCYVTFDGVVGLIKDIKKKNKSARWIRWGGLVLQKR